MTWVRRIGWLVLALATLGIAVGVYVVRLPEPDRATTLDHVSYQVGDGPVREIALPHTAARRSTQSPGSVKYLAPFDLATVPDEPLFLYVPAVNRRLVLTLNGEPLFDNSEQALWSGPLVRRTALVNLPAVLLKTGRNELTLRVAASGIEIPSHLSKLYVGTESALAPYFYMRSFFEERLKTMALAAHLLLGLGILLAYFYRPSDPLFAWLAASVAVGMIISAGYFVDLRPGFEEVRPYVVALTPAAGFLFTGIALALVGTPPPRLLRTLTIVVPAVSVLSIVTGLVRDRTLIVWINIPIMIAATIVATAIVAWGAVRRGNTDARIMLAPFFLLCWFLVRDTAVATGYLEGSLLTPYARPLLLATVMAVLMRRLAMSLDRLDRANDDLNRRLAEQENELAALHRVERIEAARLVREEERQRLTRDLHDGISGHLVSIIAMTERTGDEIKPIEQAARQALDDLRLVIYSLDLGDRELSLALANFRERLIPQLQRLGVELDWSIADLPEVSGVTPGNALAVLRILQEAITNALKHGPARKIVIRGTAAGDGQVAITVENDGCAQVTAGAGYGLDNMRRRARQLNGTVAFERLDHGARLTLLVPPRLPDFQDASAN